MLFPLAFKHLAMRQCLKRMYYNQFSMLQNRKASNNLAIIMRFIKRKHKIVSLKPKGQKLERSNIALEQYIHHHHCATNKGTKIHYGCTQTRAS